ncbi:MAG TPA: hypothetical protein VGD05_06210 [Pyrinomonadaceae bacterium]|jgi:hypothetical protein
MAITNNKNNEGEIWVNSLVSGRTFEPLVEIVWGNQKAQLSLTEARNHALYILECAEAAESDAFVFQWLTRDIIGSAQDEADNFKQIIEEFKQFREARSSSTTEAK